MRMISETPLQPTVDIDMISLMRDDEMADRPLVAGEISGLVGGVW